MKKFYVLFFISFFAVKSYGLHNLLINGSTSATITIIDTFEVSASFQTSGATATGILYRDVNDNGVLDGSDKWVGKFRLIDGNWADEDELANGVYTENRDPIAMIGKFLFYAEDGGVSDTAVIQVNPCTSSYSVYGTVTTPASTANLFVCIGDTTGGTLKYNCGDFTDNAGAYNISVPSNVTNKSKILLVVDILGVTQNYMSNQIETLTVTGNTQRNLVMQSVLPDTTVLYGTLKNDLNAPITGKSLLVGAALAMGVGKTGAIASQTNNDGTYRVRFARFTGTGYYYFHLSATLVDQFYPQYLNPAKVSAVGTFPSPSQINLELKAYRTTNTISGHVYIWNGASYDPLDKIEIDISPTTGSKSGGTYTKTYSDGHYTVDVSDSISRYYVKITPDYIPPAGYRILERDTILGDTLTAGPGNTGVDFHIRNVGIEENPLPKSSFSIKPNPFASQIILEIPSGSEPVEPLQLYDITGKKVLTIGANNSSGVTKFILTERNKRLPAGIYFYSLKTKDKTYEGKIVKLQ